jgi:hypothetical protein
VSFLARQVEAKKAKAAAAVQPSTGIEA